MFNIRRYDPSQPTASTSTAPSVTDDLAQKIEERRRKRSAADAGLSSAPASTPTVSAPPAAPQSEEDYGGWKPAPGETPAEREKRLKREKRAALVGGDPFAKQIPVQPPPSVQRAPPSATGEWQPAPGESPAEREKRIKREKRAAKFGQVSFELAPQPPSGSSYIPPPASLQSGYYDENQTPESGAVGAAGIHPSRMAVAPLLAKEAKVAGPPKEKTVAKKNYLKKKKDRAKGKRAGEPMAKPSSHKKAKLDGDAGDDEAGSDAEPAWTKDEAKREEILKKKAERKAKRDEKKAEIRRIKAEGGEVPPAPAPRIVPPTTAPSEPTAPASTSDSIAAEPTVAELEAEAEEAAKAARREAKRSKRAARRLSPPPSPPASTLLSTQPENLVGDSSLPDAVVEPEQIVAGGERQDRSVTPIASHVEPAPLLRLPTATRPAAPSAKTLSSLTVHESVRGKIVVNPEHKIAFSDESMGVSEKGQKRLEAMGIDSAFAVQTAVVPMLLPSGKPAQLYSPFAPLQDICVSAPTGSGKTLSYVVPIVETLSRRIVTRLRAIVLLPTRDLVSQVTRTFETFGSGTGLKVGIATGQHSFAHEQTLLVGDDVVKGLKGGASRVDIIIATPGRLMDHLRSTPGFTLQHLRFLVIDEADRLLNQSFHEWLPTILAALRPLVTSPLVDDEAEKTSDAMSPAWWDADIGRIPSDLYEPTMPSCQKLLFSATLSRDPAKIAALHLHRPVYVSIEDGLDGRIEDDEVNAELKFTLPSTLQEFMVFSPASHKPLYLFHLLHTLSLSSALCFTKSVEAATRLAKLVEFFELERGEKEGETKVIVRTYSSDLSAGERQKILTSFKKGEISMLICSDLIARGIDLPDVSHVISYDVPTDMRKYVHRVGRTARAGKAGDAWSLVEDQEAAPFRTVMREAQHWNKIKRVRVNDDAVAAFVPHYQAALERLKAHFATGKGSTD